MSGLPIAPIPGTKQIFAATTTPINVTAVRMASGNGWRCYNHSTTDWANVFFTTDQNVIGAVGGAPGVPPAGVASVPFDKTKYGSQIPPGGFIDYTYMALAPGQTSLLFSCWMDSGSGANVVIENIRI